MCQLVGVSVHMCQLEVGVSVHMCQLVGVSVRMCQLEIGVSVHMCQLGWRVSVHMCSLKLESFGSYVSA